MHLNGPQRQQFQQALLSAFPSKAKLAQMVSFELDWELDAIAGGQNQSEIIFSLIQHAESTGHLDPLLIAACRQNPGNPVLQSLTQSFTNPNPVKNSVKTILLLAANPKDSTRLRIDEEVREIQNGLDRARNRDKFLLQQRWAITVRELRRAFLDCHPNIIHFSGHGLGSRGDSSSESRDIAIATNPTPEGIFLEDDQGNAQLVPGPALADLFAIFADPIDGLILNACYSETQANAIIQHIPYVIGMSRTIGDRAAIEFSIGFYDGLLAGQPIEAAYKLGCNAIQLQGIPEHLTPILKHRDA